LAISTDTQLKMSSFMSRPKVRLVLLDRAMRMQWTLFAGLALAVSAALGQSSTGDARRAGPAADPYGSPDFGGTPDVSTSSEISLSKEEINSLLERVKSPSQAQRVKAVEEIQRVASGSEQTLREVLWGGHGARNSDMRKAVLTARRRAETSKEPGDLLGELAAVDPRHPDLGAGTSGALRILSMLSALNTLNTMAAYKVMIEFSPRHAGVFRQEIGSMLVGCGLDALPALVYGRGSSDSEIHMFAVKWIRDMGNPLLSQQVKIKNPRRLAQLLEAYASVRDLDAVEVTLALANHESSFVRTAARLCIKSYGENAKWPARRIYENTFSKEPPDNADVSKMLDEIFKYYDAQRLAPMTALFEEGLAAYKKGRYEKMESSYRKVLKAAPMFPKRDRMADGFFAYARSLMDRDQGGEAEEKLRMAYRLAEPDTETAGHIRAELNWLKAEKLRAAGIADLELYKLVLKDNPSHEAAAEWVEKLANPDASIDKIVTKVLIVSFFVFLAASLVFLRLRK
jgi:tetratricopeptide (TPR) repeat protein